MEQPRVSLLALDIDGTIAHSFDPWQQRSATAWRGLAEIYGVDYEALVDGIAPLPHVARDVDLEALTQLHPLLKDRALSAEQEAAKDALVLAYKQQREAALTLMPGARELIEQAHAAGTKVVIYTDAKESDMAHRLFRMGVPLDAIDGAWCRPDDVTGLEKPPLPLDSPEGRYRQALAAKLHHSDRDKPSGWQLQAIADAMGAPIGETIMVGDTVKDAGCSQQSGALFAFQRDGARVRPETEALMARLAPHYPIGEARTEAEIAKSGARIDIDLDKGIGDLARQLSFAAPPSPKAAPANTAPTNTAAARKTFALRPGAQP